MTLSAGTRIGPYEVVAPLGAGGMGEVYRATDTNLKRAVALKVLPASVATDPERLARFQREAELLAQLNHPHIAQIYGVERAAGTIALVMELVEGPTLAERMARGRLDTADAMGIAIQIASAMTAAHAQGIVHRDLKPANIKLRPDGQVKVLDFGLAKALEPFSGASEVSSQAATAAPALATGAGTVLGTAAYMSPEQARGEPVDKRADIWAFGAVLFELLTGKRAFPGNNITDTLVAVVKTEPDWAALPNDTPPSVRWLLPRILDKQLHRRVPDMAVVQFEFNEARDWAKLHDHPKPPDHRGRAASLVAIVACVVAAGLAVPALRYVTGTDQELPEFHTDIVTPATTASQAATAFALSPEGDRLAFAAPAGTQPSLWIRSLRDGASRALPKTEGASYPFWSPDGRSIAFFAGGRLKRIDVDGDLIRDLAGAPTARGGSWSRSGVIVFAPVATGALFRVADTGGDARQLTKLSPQQTDHRSPWFLPDGRHFVYYARGGDGGRGVYVSTTDGAETRRLFDADAGAVYVDPGHLLYVRGRVLFAQAFDTATLEPSGVPVEVARDVFVSGVSIAAVSAAEAGTIAYRIGTNPERTLTWFSRSGQALEETGVTGATGPELSSDGRRVAMGRTVDGRLAVWILETAGNRLSRLTSGETIDYYPVWSPDGREIALQSTRDGRTDLFTRALDSTGAERPILSSPEPKFPLAWSSDGRFLLYRSQQPKTGNDILAVSVDGKGEPLVIARTHANEDLAQLSPDGRWVAYQSDESSRLEIYVQAFPSAGGRILVSSAGGAQPRWSGDGRQVFYVALSGELMSVSLARTAGGHVLEPGKPVVLFQTHVGGAVTGDNRQQYAVSRDGQRFLMATLGEAPLAPITLVQHWKRGVPR